MRIFMTGATGLVGTALKDEFLKQSFEITAVSRKKHENGKNISWIQADISEGLKIENRMQGHDVIVHNAACLYPGENEEQRKELQKVNIDFTRQLLEWSSINKIKKFIYTSSFSVLAKPLPKLITETSAVKPTRPYADSKWQGEKLVEEHAKKNRIQYFNLRISSPVSFDIEAMPQTVVRKWIDQSREGKNIKIFGEGKREQDFVALPDIADAFVKCIHNTVDSGLFNISSGVSLSMIELAKLVTEKFGNQYMFMGDSENETDLVRISIDKARTILNYHPGYTSKEAIETLLNNIS